MHVVGKLCVPEYCGPILVMPKLHHNVFVSVVAVPVLQLFVEEQDVTIVKLIPTAFIFVVPGVQNAGKHEYALLDIPKNPDVV
jgi:hypothetical protein